jgi:hypothetical protein
MSGESIDNSVLLGPPLSTQRPVLASAKQSRRTALDEARSKPVRSNLELAYLDYTRLIINVNSDRG